MRSMNQVQIGNFFKCLALSFAILPVIASPDMLFADDVSRKYDIGDILLTVRGDMRDPHLPKDIDLEWLIKEAVIEKVGRSTVIERKIKGKKSKEKIGINHEIVKEGDVEKKIEIIMLGIELGEIWKARFRAKIDIPPLKKDYTNKVSYSMWDALRAEFANEYSTQVNMMAEDIGKKVKENLEDFLGDYMEEYIESGGALTLGTKPKESPGSSEERARTFFYEDFSDVKEGLIPEGWFGGTSMMVKREKSGEHVLTEFEIKPEHSIKALNIPFPTDFEFEVEFLWDYGCIYLSLGQLEIRLRDTGDIRIVNTDVRLGKGLANKKHLLKIIRDGDVFKFLLDYDEIHTGRYPQFQQMDSFSFKTSTACYPARHFAIYRIEGSTTGGETTYLPRDIQSPEEKEPVIRLIHSDVDQAPVSKISRPKGVAVVIGIEEYREKIPSAAFAKTDAEVMRDYLKNTFGLAEERIRTRLNRQATKGEFDLIFSPGGWLTKRVEEGAPEIFIYFSGHGAQDYEEGSAYLIPYDGNPDFTRLSCYSLQKMYDNLGTLNVENIIVVLDACFSGFSGRGEQLEQLSEGSRPVTSKPKHPLLKAKNIVVFTAAEGAQTSTYYPATGHGLFTYFFLKGLMGGADQDGNKKISVGEQYQYVRENVPREAVKMEKEQTPELMPPLELIDEMVDYILVKY